jgi:hypothetical protein
MTEKNKAARQAAPKKETLTHAGSSAQRARLLTRLQTGLTGTVITQIALSIPVPAALVKALCVQEPSIKNLRITLIDDHARPRHGVALYYFGAQANSKVAACNERNAIQLGV